MFDYRTSIMYNHWPVLFCDPCSSQEVETEHSWAFTLLASQLGALFKSTYSMLKV